MNKKICAGYIDLIIGPMFAGKSTELQRKVKRLTHAKKKCLIINYINDNRYGADECVVTHDQQRLQAKKISKLKDVMDIYMNYDVIAIDEGQFFPDIDELSEFFANQGKIVIIAALDATFQRKGFEKIINLIPMAENVTKLSSICINCSKEAFFTKRLIDNQEIELIGGGDIYKPVCRSCFFADTNNNSSNSKTSIKSNNSIMSDEKEKVEKKLDFIEIQNLNLQDQSF